MKQKNKVQLLLVAALGCLSVMGYAQGKVCEGTVYQIQELQAPSDPSAFEWWEDGKKIETGNAAGSGYTVPADKAVGKYTYIRRSKKEGCDWASSNVYTVEVMACATLGSESEVGDKGVFTDPRDGKTYKTVKMPDGKVWFAENLNYQTGLTFNQNSNQANGLLFATAGSGTAAIGSFWCPPLNGATVSADKNTCNVFGALYTWETAMSEDGKGAWEEAAISDKYYATGGVSSGATFSAAKGTNNRGICPIGWYIPTDAQWAALLDLVDPACGSYSAQTATGWYGSIGTAEETAITGAGVKMKSASTYIGTEPGTGAWQDNANRGNDATGFGAVPACRRYDNGSQFSARGLSGFYWSSSVTSATNAWNRQFYHNFAQVARYNDSRSFGLSVRCVQH
jgi:uncharacterized protein (TIGR02145 family)